MVLNDSNEEIGERGQLRRYRLFGHTIASTRPLASWLPPSFDPPDLTISFVSQAPIEWNPADTVPAFLSQMKTDEGKSILTLYTLGTCKVIRLLEYADFYLWPERLVCRLHEEAPTHLIRSFLFTNVLPFWLELKGYVTIHASAVNISGNAIAFLAHSRNGKSTLAASLVSEGFPLLSDDVLPIRPQAGLHPGVQDRSYWASPGYPAMRMWPGEAEHFLAEYEHLERVHPELSKRYVPVGDDQFGPFCNHPCPLERIYILERRETSDLPASFEMKRVSHRDALIELLRYSFITRLAEAVGLAADRFDFFSSLVQKVPVHHLIYPSGYEHLPEIRQSILSDLSG